MPCELGGQGASLCSLAVVEFTLFSNSRDPPASVTWMLGLKVHITTALMFKANEFRVRLTIIISLIFLWGNWGTEPSSILPNIGKGVESRVKPIQLRSSSLSIHPAHALHLYIFTEPSSKLTVTSKQTYGYMGEPEGRKGKEAIMF